MKSRSRCSVGLRNPDSLLSDWSQRRNHLRTQPPPLSPRPRLTHRNTHNLQKQQYTTHFFPPPAVSAYPGCKRSSVRSPDCSLSSHHLRAPHLSGSSRKRDTVVSCRVFCVWSNFVAAHTVTVPHLFPRSLESSFVSFPTPPAVAALGYALVNRNASALWYLLPGELILPTTRSAFQAAAAGLRLNHNPVFFLRVCFSRSWAKTLSTGPSC